MTSWSVIYYRLRRNFDGLKSEFCDGEVVVPESEEGKDDEEEEEEEDQGKGKGKGKREFLTGMNVTSLTKLSEGGVEITYEDKNEANKEVKMKADMVILADGANSSLRAKYFPDVKREYAGYVAFRGTVLESEVSEETKKIFDPSLTYFSYKGGYILLYVLFFFLVIQFSPYFSHSSTLHNSQSQSQGQFPIPNSQFSILNSQFLNLKSQTPN